MAAVAAVGSLLYEGYSDVAANQRRQQAKGQAQTLLDKQTKMTADAIAKTSVAAGQAGAAQRARAKGAAGPSSTILTSPQGAGMAPTEKKTLLGL